MVMRILILGGDGFIGSHLATALKKSPLDEVFILDKEDLRSTRNGIAPSHYIKKEIRNSIDVHTVIHKYEPEFIVNCIAVATPHYYVTNPHDTFDLDFTINHEIIKAVQFHCIPFIHFSTSEVYGKKWTGVCKEDTTNLVIGPTHKSRWIYATSKILLEQLLLSGEDNNFCIVRPQNFCGWDMDWLPDISTNVDRKWKPRLPACMLNNLSQKKPLYVVLPGTQKRCYTHINDGIDGILSIIGNWDECKGQVFNIGNPLNEVEIVEMASLMEDMWNELKEDREQDIEHISGEKFYGKGYEDCDRRLFDASKLARATGWRAKIDLDDTVRLLVKEAIENYPL